MDESDYDTFACAFGRVSGVFRLRLNDADKRELTRTYFKVLQHARIEAVLAAGKVCLATCRSFPKPVEWLDALVMPVAPADPTADRRTMTITEAAELAAAERLHYEDAPCDCLACHAAQVTQRGVRYVPDFTDDGRVERALHPITQREVQTGHWAHGAELARWYVARDQFFGLAVAKGHAYVVPLVTREPGQEG